MTATQIPLSPCVRSPLVPAMRTPCLSKVDPAAIAARNVGMMYQSGAEQFEVLSHIDLDVKAGDIQLLMGPSGSGKTTLLSILAGILTPTSGSVQLLGEEITAMSSAKLARFRLLNIGFIFQGFNLFPALTALENVEVALNLKGLRGASPVTAASSLLAALSSSTLARMVLVVR